MLDRKILLLLNKYAQQTDPELASPEIRIEPVDSFIQQAVNLLKQKDSNFFVGVRKIVVDTGTGFGHVASGPQDDPTVIHINLAKIKSELQSKGLSGEQFNKELVRQISLVIAHERGHVKSYKPEGGFIGGEVPAEQAEKEMAGKIK